MRSEGEKVIRILKKMIVASMAVVVMGGVSHAQKADFAFAAKDVDKQAVQLDNGVAPQFPDSLLALGISGWAKVAFVVDSTGRVDMASFLPIESGGSPLFWGAVREALPRMRFIPAQIAGRSVRERIERRFEFDSPIPRPCKSPCPFMLLPLVTPPSTAVPNSNPLAELQGKISQGRLPFVVQKITAADMPIGAGTFREYQVDKPASPKRRNVAPVYPDSLKKAKVSGEVVAKFVVDTSGHVTIESIEVVSSTNQFFAMSVLEALPRMTFSPAELNKVKVPQVVQQPFIFHAKQ
ncbi:MAG TPA: energy transducer TonB [Gemmatimonadaceae bacterium]|nr:energy transducer TonB [Gemmatimonadaceae bacterium]